MNPNPEDAVKSQIKCEAILAEQELKANGRIRVIVQDNGSIHKSLEVREYWTKWESLGLYIFSKQCI
ncbi:hypothetical protein [Nostoc sp. KVJ3]|uniref:hypothetical protein n=1 Tax=Nostoc sp. KVJ3 TaxID=457945 RepID=UPI002237E195|nr:hypothetical protein [Nostoc sp. KVJ3]